MKVLYIGDKAQGLMLKKFKPISKLVLFTSIDEMRNMLSCEESMFDMILIAVDRLDLNLKQVVTEMKRTLNQQPINIIAIVNEESHAILTSIYDAGVNDYMTRPLNEVKLMFKTRGTVEMNATREDELKNVIQQLESSNLTLKRLAQLDQLTGMYNRRFFDEYISKTWKRAGKKNINLSIIMVDVDDFKTLNDEYGHLIGDECLKQVGSTLQSTAEELNGVVTRYGGDEFLVVFQGIEDAQVIKFAEKMRSNVEKLFAHQYLVTVSLGVASVIPNQSLSLESFINFADQALYRVKEAGGNGCFFQRNFTK